MTAPKRGGRELLVAAGLDPDTLPTPSRNGQHAPDDAAAADRDESFRQSEQLAASRARFRLEQLLPSSTAEAVAVVTRALPADPLSAALPLLAGYSGLLKLGTGTRISTSKTIPANLFVCLLGTTGIAKTTFLELLVQGPARDVRADAARHHQRQQERWEQDELPKKAADRRPKPLRIFPHLTGYTTEALDRQLAANEQLGLGQLIIRDEISGLLGSIDQYGKGKGAGDAQLLEAFDGNAKAEIRIGDDPRAYERCHVSIYTNGQPEVLRAYVNGADHQGKYARFLFVKPPHRPLDLAADDPTADAVRIADQAMQVLRAQANRLYALAPRVYVLSQDARALYVEWFRAHQERALLPGTPSTIAALLNKTSAHAVRLATNMHVLWIAADEIAPCDEIPAETMATAMAVVDQLAAETEAFHEGEEPIESQVMRCINAISLKAGGPVDRATARNKAGRKLRPAITAESFHQAITDLQRLGYGVVSGGSYTASRSIPD